MLEHIPWFISCFTSGALFYPDFTAFADDVFQKNKLDKKPRAGGVLSLSTSEVTVGVRAMAFADIFPILNGVLRVFSAMTGVANSPRYATSRRPATRRALVGKRMVLLYLWSSRIGKYGRAGRIFHLIHGCTSASACSRCWNTFAAVVVADVCVQ